MDVVVLTHVHDDHLAWQEELAQRFDEDRAIWDRLLAPLRSRGVLQAIDDDPETAGRARRGLIAELVDSDRLLAPAHFAEPFGRLVSDGPAGQVSWQPIG